MLSKSQQVSITPVPISVDRTFTNIVGMCQDNKGFLWLADNYNGLLRYDGSNLISYKSNPRNPNSLSSDKLECLCTGLKGNIWIGTYQNGLDRFEPETETFTHFRHNNADPSSLCGNMIGALLEDQNGTLWVGTNKGLDTLNRQTGKFTHIENNSEDGLALSRESIRILYEDKSGTIWIGCGNPFGTQDPLLHGLYKVDKATGKITRYQHKDKDETSLTDNRVRAIFEDSRGVFWIGTAGDGLHIMDREKGIFHRCLHDPQNSQKLSRPPVNAHALYAADHITFINEDMQGCIWIGTYAAGINRYNPATKTIEYFGTSGTGSHKIDKNDYWGLLKTKDNLLWATGWEPANDNQVLYKISTLPNQLIYSHLDIVVNGFAEDADGIMWLGTNKGLLRNTKDSLFSDSNTTFPKYAVANLEHDSLNNLWVSTMSGLYYYDKITNTCTGFRHDDKDSNSISTDVVFVTQLVGNGKILVGTNRGLDELDIRSGIFKHYTYDPKDSTSINANRVTSIKKDRSGSIWVGTAKGLNRFDQHSGKFSNGLEVNGSAIFFIFEDSRSRVWIGTYRSGLYVYNQRSGNFSLFSDSTNLVNSSMLIRAMAEDKEHLLWLQTDIGFIQLNPETKNAVLFGKTWGIDPKIAFKHGFTSSQGEIYFGDTAGYYHFQPESFKKEIGLGAQPYIGKFFISNKELIPGKNNILPQILSQTEKITLNYNQNNFAIEFNNIDFITLEAEKNLLYKLYNYDDAWRKGNGEKMAYYYNVQPGQYVFRVKAVNSNGIWAERSIAIIITPPWWSTWWFKIAAVIFVIVGFYSLIRWRLYEKFNRQLELSGKEKKLVELQQQKTEVEMQMLRAQMNPHFIFNSLNSINRFILQNNSSLASEYLTKFSRLVRMILQNSQAPLISLENELESLKLYLELEALRFNYHFAYKITVPKDLDIDVLKVPPLIIQPYAENAIWHGLMHKEEKGKLDIEISLESNLLVFKISDDGVGRKAATATASKSATRHKSMGLQITADRISKLQNSNGTKSPVTIIDLVHPDGSGAGTEVIIKIPVIYD
ncbi:MAG: two-component regulator propeller domain-containing protein [Saprospiraceae bacterium]